MSKVTFTPGKAYTYHETLGPAMKIEDQAEADEYFEALVVHAMQYHVSREEAIATCHNNLGYYAGYYDGETRERVERLFRCSHPVFGSIAEKGSPSPEEAFTAGVRLGADGVLEEYEAIP